jgi:hypothetical protein
VFRNSPQHSANKGLAHSKLVRNVLLRIPFGTQFSHSSGHVMSDFWVRIAATFGVHVCHVIRDGPEKQMLRVNTFAVIAFVQHVQVPDFTDKISVGKPVSGHCFAVDLELSVSTFRQTRLPLMTAGFHLFHLC